MSWDELVAAGERIRDTAVAKDSTLADYPVTGIGWATVDADRALVQLDGLLAPAGEGEESPPPSSWTPLARDAALGARVWLRAMANSGSGPWLVVLEPDTESRLAASLARFGEGVAVVYLGEGLLRSGRLVRGGPAWGPHVMILAAPEPPTI
ncbi:MAG: hypothetical protein ABIZ52_02165 [Candidatus Limnocylindrales bacterium]